MASGCLVFVVLRVTSGVCRVVLSGVCRVACDVLCFLPCGVLCCDVLCTGQEGPVPLDLALTAIDAPQPIWDDQDIVAAVGPYSDQEHEDEWQADFEAACEINIFSEIRALRLVRPHCFPPHRSWQCVV
jgi:hypothetical protein